MPFFMEKPFQIWWWSGSFNCHYRFLYGFKSGLWVGQSELRFIFYFLIWTIPGEFLFHVLDEYSAGRWNYNQSGVSWFISRGFLQECDSIQHCLVSRKHLKILADPSLVNDICWLVSCVCATFLPHTAFWF